MISTVVLPVAGLGTRFLPATKSVPKELLPIVDRPLVQYAVEEAFRAGIRHVVLVSSPLKTALERHLQPADAVLVAELEAKGKRDLLEALQSATPAGLTLSVVYQPQALGLGHAVLCAREVLAALPGGEQQSFAVMLPDDFIDAPGQGCLADMVALHRDTGAWSLAVEEVPPEQTDKYGVVSLAEGSLRMTAMVEKPKPAEAPSNLAVVGRYVLPGAVFAALAEVRPGAGGEIQLTDGIAALLASHDIRAHRFSGVRYDCGSKLGYAKANFALALRDPGMGPALKAWLKAEDLA
ncbi:MAG: UTP--glucose-1-phosphate uridylyltransferase [Pseudomonadota bacterium]